MMKRNTRTEIRFSRIAIFVLAISLSAGILAAEPSVKFPGPQPGPALSSQRSDIFTLENNVLSVSWKMNGGVFHPLTFKDKLSQTSAEQTGAELFRLATKPAVEQTNGVYVGMRLEADSVVVMASKNGEAWSDLASFSRTEFAGDPKLVRVGKMNLKAQAKDHYDKGAPGECKISDLSPAPKTIPSNRFEIKTGANQTAIAEYAFPKDTRTVSCKIDKGTDQGMSWAPALALIWEDGKTFLLLGVRDKNMLFNITTATGEKTKHVKLENTPLFDLPSSAFRLTSTPRIIRLQADEHGVRLSEKINGTALEADLVSTNGLRARWRAELRDDSNYIRNTIELSAQGEPVSVKGVQFTDIHIPNAKSIGTVPGCPVVADNSFFGVEMPGAQNALNGSGAKIGFACTLEVSPSQSYSFGSVAGVAAPGQLRRSFLYYVERERARPSKPFLHYNCWYDLGYGPSEAKVMDVAKAFNDELVKKRGVPVLSYLVDDGWDNPGKGLWIENTNSFPYGFAGLNEKMKQINAHLSVWISPLGGYGGAKERTEWASKMGLIPAGTALDLAQPAYKKWFQDRCLQLMRESGVNAFKWDKAGNGVNPHFMALLDVARNLRKENPDVFINVTVGTWPSPFWLNHVDCTWRDGSGDVGWSGKGRDPDNKFDREKWLTFRDGYCRRLFVEASPLYPLNSVMHHGIVHGIHFQGGSIGKANPPDLKNEARSYFANGASLQELYLTPSLMTSAAWDQVAEAAKWGNANADVLADAHWIGGDPLKDQAYGYAAWNTRKGTLMLRNPDDKPQTMTLDAEVVFELPANAPRNYALSSPYKDQRIQSLNLKAREPRSVTLDPFEVLVFDAQPLR